MDTEQILAQLLADPPDTTSLAQPLPDDISEAVVARLKDEVDRNWYNDPHCSVRLSEIIICIGQQRNDLNQIALGTMARGDSLKFLGNLADAWADLEQAGNFYLEAGNDFGWARTRIGRLYICVDLNRVEQALREGQQARQIFEQHGDTDRIIRLNLNVGHVYNRLGKLHESLHLYEETLALALKLDSLGELHKGAIYTNLGYTHHELGNMSQALYYFEQAQSLATLRNENRRRALAEINIAYVRKMHGHYREALQHLYKVQELTQENLPAENALARRMQLECYLNLNRFEEATEIANKLLIDYEAIGADYDKALTLRYLATALVELRAYAAAENSLNDAAAIFLDTASTRLARLQIEQGYMRLQSGDLHSAYKLADDAYKTFETTQEQIYMAEAALLRGKTQYRSQAWEAAFKDAKQVLSTARIAKHPTLQYNAHTLLGYIHEAQAQPQRALRHYQAAHLTIERMQRGLTITLRTGFLTNKLDAIQSQLRLYLARSAVDSAFLTLERMKAQVLFSYLTRQENLRWMVRDTSVAKRIEELNRLRDEHQWYYEMLHGDLSHTDRKSAYSTEQLTDGLMVREKKIRALTERLYLENDSITRNLAFPALGAMQHALAPQQAMIAYYNDGSQLWAFIISATTCDVIALPGTVANLDKLVHQFQFNIDCALAAGQNAPILAQLTKLSQKLSQHLYDLLIEPLHSYIELFQHLTIVPYGSLHYLPFHLLRSGEQYLIEQYEINVLPTASWITQPAIQQPTGVLALAHSWGQRLPQVVTEALNVQQLFGGQVYVEEQAKRHTLTNPLCQILHIAAHGEYRMDHPELSYIQLADGQLYTDDLWQHDLSYELVTLSACETGRANVMPGEELIGLGRGFLYAGAGALLTSLWRVPDSATYEFMTRVYSQLNSGTSKAAALRAAMLAQRDAQLNQHPAFWGAYQLIGNANPLSHFIQV